MLALGRRKIRPGLAVFNDQEIGYIGELDTSEYQRALRDTNGEQRGIVPVSLRLI
jgi:hypothetical protein